MAHLYDGNCPRCLHPVQAHALIKGCMAPPGDCRCDLGQMAIGHQRGEAVLDLIAEFWLTTADDPVGDQELLRRAQRVLRGEENK